MTTYMVGWSHTSFGILDDEDVESLIICAPQEALTDTNLQDSDVKLPERRASPSKRRQWWPMGWPQPVGQLACRLPY